MISNRGRARELVLDAVRRVVTVGGALTPVSQARLAEVEALLGGKMLADQSGADALQGPQGDRRRSKQETAHA
jgi:hypothetical protein